MYYYSNYYYIGSDNEAKFYERYWFVKFIYLRLDCENSIICTILIVLENNLTALPVSPETKQAIIC